MKSHITTQLFILLAISFTISCNSSPNYTDSGAVMMDKSKYATAPDEAANGDAMETIERKLIKEGFVEFETNSIEDTRETIQTAVAKYKGYISSDNEYKAPGRTSNTVHVRIPSKDFDAFLAEATTGVERFDNKSISVLDVTEEFMDIEARIKTKKELETRYLELLKLAKSITEMMEIERQLSNLRTEIESVEGRLKYLEKSVSFSTLNITFYENIPNSVAFGKKFQNGFRNGWDNLIWFFVALVNIWPFVLLTIALVLGIRRYRRRKSAQ